MAVVRADVTGICMGREKVKEEDPEREVCQ